MIDFDIEKFVRKYMTGRAESLLKADFEKFADEMHAPVICNSFRFSSL